MNRVLPFVDAPDFKEMIFLLLLSSEIQFLFLNKWQILEWQGLLENVAGIEPRAVKSF